MKTRRNYCCWKLEIFLKLLKLVKITLKYSFTYVHRYKGHAKKIKKCDNSFPPKTLYYVKYLIYGNYKKTTLFMIKQRLSTLSLDKTHHKYHNMFRYIHSQSINVARLVYPCKFCRIAAQVRRIIPFYCNIFSNQNRTFHS